ncbi:MAG: two-component system response regulator [Phototrophicales bacterium]|nr:MAG: two-component system response regulator [Phototrophicales bacterium]
MAVKILVVDDLSDMRMLLGLTLRRNQWEVIEAEDGEQAIELARAEQPQVILMDYDMPNMNGLEACKRLVSDEVTAHIPVVIYTGYSASHVREDALSAGATTFLIKPITPARLREEIVNLLSR